jgi:hypothetical protein
MFKLLKSQQSLIAIFTLVFVAAIVVIVVYFNFCQENPTKTPFTRVFLLGKPRSIPGLVPPPVFRFQQQLEHLCNGHAYDLVESAIRKQSCTLYYGDFWSTHQSQMRKRFPDALWVRLSPDLGDDGPYVNMEDFTGRETPLPCACLKALVNMHCLFMDDFTESKKGFIQQDSSGITSVFVDGHAKSASPTDKTRSIAWFVEPFQYLKLNGNHTINEKLFSRVYKHGRGKNGHIPFTVTWIPYKDYIVSHAKVPKAGLIFSDKTYMTGHKLRHDVWNAVKTRGDVVANGTGVNKHLEIKTPGIAPYMYAIVIENGIEDGYWSEKLVDSVILKCVVFYWGAPNVHDWFLPDSVIPFYDIDELKILLNNMSVDDYNSRLKAVNLNYHRAQAWTSVDDGLLLETDFMSSVEYKVTPCTGKCKQT